LALIFHWLFNLQFIVFAADSFDGTIVSTGEYVALFVLVPLKLIYFRFYGVSGS
jgi:hypothetical protein